MTIQKRTRKNYAEDFKRDAVALVTEQSTIRVREQLTLILETMVSDPLSY